MNITKKIVLQFTNNTVDQPILYKLIKNYDLVPTIIKAEINPHKDGFLAIEIEAAKENYKNALAWLKSIGIKVTSLDEQVIWDKDKCTHCGACTGACPTGALYIKRPEMTVDFNSEKCIVCYQCLKACPFKTISVKF
ncbi:MAG: 4Fe-4S binding protein [Clostridia bacterium]|nr:4Fe-4S binding protein [Clostridia bacterium]MDD4572094.1 4Fe-4S binding protein [Clostridia bacterium]